MISPIHARTPVLDRTACDTRRVDFKVADLSLARSGRDLVRGAERELPGLMAARAQFQNSKPLAGVRVTAALCITTQTAVLAETLVDLGAQVRLGSCDNFTTQDELAAALVVGPLGTPSDPQGLPVFAWRGQTLQDYWWSITQALTWPAGDGPDVILEDSGRASLVVRTGLQLEAGQGVSPPTGTVPGFGALAQLLQQTQAETPDRWHRIASRIEGSGDQRATIVAHLFELAQAGSASTAATATDGQDGQPSPADLGQPPGSGLSGRLIRRDDWPEESTDSPPPRQMLDGRAAFADQVLGPAASDLPRPPGDDEDDFVPPEPPPIPRGTVAARFAWLGAIGGPILMLISALLGLGTPIAAVGLIGFITGFGALVAMTPDRPRTDDGWDDGAVL